ncbi:indole-3-glycerol phosphate synthase TrpC [Bacillus sp. T33-2]|uniref:indole-3-glycerol phosphate synthase TrpC n=1 Tax=Bacillus sp. T33-2 TaxID=2054168 RepID=UPI000C789E44|nr:indole-3-glycerol phosphate synthase TrpC [Bacillus sp. T33-2]PLR98814.1 indole-3-glycerol phosphate synthase TrpC [Bacillus sp. T33-2]
METILDRIIARKRAEVAEMKKIATLHPENQGLPSRSLLETMKNSATISIISEFKRASPSKGDINIQADPAEQAVHYADCGADAVSVLTDANFFKGSFTDLNSVANAVPLPVLCKDFIIDKVQIDHAQASGASLVLLIAAALKREELFGLHRYAIESGLEVLVEIHDEEDLEKALAAGPKLIGVNNRDLKTFRVDLKNTEKLGPLVKEAGPFLISESGIKTQDDVRRAAAAGADGILVGETFMTSSNLKETFNELKVPKLGAALK